MPGTSFKLDEVLDVSEWHIQRNDGLICFILLGKDNSEHPFKFDCATSVQFAQELLRASGTDTSQPT
jgi:hypothetical protein